MGRRGTMRGRSPIRLCGMAAMAACAGILAAGTAMGSACVEGTVNIGDSPQAVTLKYGEAMFKDARDIKVETEDDHGATSSTDTKIEEWTYDCGPGELLQTIRLENGEVVRVESSGYGKLPDTADTCRNGGLLAVGDTPLAAFLKCGEPIAREPLADREAVTKSGGETRRTGVTVTEWTYRYGPDLPGVTLTIENGVVTGIRSREYGK